MPGADGETSRLRLDQIPLPPGTPPPAQDSAPARPSGEPDPEPPRGRQGGCGRLPAPTDTVHRTGPRRIGRTELDAAALAQGLPVPGGVLLRMARRGDTAEVSRLLAMAGLDLPPYLAEAIDNQDIGSTLMHALEAGNDQILTALATAAHRGDPNLAMPGLTALLVAENAATAPAGRCWPCRPRPSWPRPPVPGFPSS